MTITLAEELVLLAYRDDDGAAPIAAGYLDYGIAGAYLLELVLAERIDLRDERVVVTSAEPTGDPLLDAALERIGAETKPRKPEDWIGRLQHQGRKPVLARLVDAGILERRDDRVLLVFPRTRFPAPEGTPPTAEADVRQRLHAAVTGTGPVDARTAAMCALIGALGWESFVFPDLAKKDVERRIAELLAGDWAGVAVRRAVQQLQAMLAASMAAIVVITTVT